MPNEVQMTNDKGRVINRNGHICEKCCYLGADKIRHENARTTVVCLSGMIRFGKRVVFLEIEQLLFVRKEMSSGTFRPNVHRIRFVGLPSVFTSGGGRQSDAVKPGMIRFVKRVVFSEVQ